MSYETNASLYAADGYRLGRSFSASARLNLQHYLWKDVLGYNIHPKIPVQNRPDFRIADVGTGTGIWLIDVSRQLPSAQLDGFDVSAAQYPPKEWLPSNISLQTLDVFTSIPKDLQGKYDVVNVRLFLAVVKNNDPSPILRNLMRMLKPSGYLQWSEHNLGDSTVETVKPGLNKDNVQFLLDYTRSLISLGLDQPPNPFEAEPSHSTDASTYAKQISWPPHLAETFTTQGLQNVAYDRHLISTEIRVLFTQMHFMLNEELSFVAMDNSGPNEEGPQHRKRVQAAAEDAKEGVGYEFIIQLTYGQNQA